MEQAKIDRINQLARRVKAGETLSPAELAERDALRREYVDSVKAALTDQLDRVRVAGPDGSLRRLNKRRK